MGAGPVSVAIGLLVLGTGTLLYPAGAGAIPPPPGLPPDTSELAPDLSANNQRADGNEKGAAQRIDNTADSPVLTSEGIVTPHGPTDLRITGARHSIPCLLDSHHETPSDDSTGQRPCTGPAHQQRFSIQIGSRIATHSNMLGELDGIRVDYRLASGLTVKGVAGYPVLSSNDKFNTTRQMFGINAVTGKFARGWDLNSYLVEQQDSGEIASRSVGAAVRYMQPGRSLLVFADYDVFEKSLGSFMTSGAWTLPYKTTLNATLDIRNSPIRRQQQKYLQQTMDNSEGWQWILPDSRIEHYTKDRSNQVATLALGLSHTFLQRIKLSSDIAVMDVSKSVESDGSTTATSRLSEYFYHLRLSGTDMIIAGDKNIIDLRHQVTGSSKLSSVSIDTQYPINRYWKISPRLVADYRDNSPQNSAQWVTSPTVKVEYRWKEEFGFQFQAGAQWSALENRDGFETGFSYFAKLGCNAKF